MAIERHECAPINSAVGSALGAVLQYFFAAQCLLSEHWPHPPATVPMDGTRFDFIVVGAGTAGATIAARLAQIESMSVLLIEAGGDAPQESIIPGFKTTMMNSRYDWNFTSASGNNAGQALEGGWQPQTRGRMLGGTDSLNDMIYSRGYPKDYERWEAGSEWDWETILRYFKKTEHLTDTQILSDPRLMQYHAIGGEIEVSAPKQPSGEVESLLKAFNELGYPTVLDMTNPEKLGAGRFLHTIRDGKRVSSASAILNKVARTGNIMILRNALVSKILVNSTQAAHGVKVIIDNKVYQYHADKEVILSAGTFNTPKILMLSGIGPKEHLEQFNIALVKDLPVGENLHDHPMFLNYLVADSNLCSKNIGENQVDLIKYLHNRSGPLGSPDAMGLYFPLSSSTDRSVPDFGIYPVCMPRKAGYKEGCMKVLNFKEYICDKIAEANEHHEILSFAVVNLNPQSRGRVRLASLNPFDNPDINLGIFNDASDLEDYPEAIEIVHSIVNTTYLRRKGAYILDLEISECKNKSREEAMKCQARAMGIPAWHAVGSAAIGSVVDSRLRVKGVTGLRVVDASVMPRLIRSNTNAPTVMIAERAADLIKQDHRLGEFAPKKSKDKTEQIDNTEKTGNLEKTDNTEKTDNSEKTEKTENTNTTDKTDQTEKPVNRR